MKIELPKPSGPFSVGVMDFELTDEGREEHFKPGTRRRIPVRAWYPASSIGGAPRPYAKPLEMEHQLMGAVRLGMASEDITAAFDVPTHAYEDAPVLRDERRPVLIFSHGGFVYVQSNTALMEHLASHGYVMLSIGHPHMSMATIHENGEIVPCNQALIEAMKASASEPGYMDAFVSSDIATRLEAHLTNGHEAALAPQFIVWEDDFIHVVDRLHKGDLPAKAQPLLAAIDLDRLGVLGMSFGASGSAAAQRDPRIRAAVNLDGGVFDPDVADSESRVPVLVMHSDTAMIVPGTAAKPHSEFYYERFETIGTRADVNRVEVKGATHMAFTDICLLPPALRAANPMAAAVAGTIAGPRMAEIMNNFVKRFFDHYLGGQGAGLDAEFRKAYPEVVDVDLGEVRAWAAGNPEPGFMSYRHVQKMNRILEKDANSIAACAALGRPYAMAYELFDGPKGKTVWWQMRFDPVTGIAFSLRQPAAPADLTLRGDWKAMIGVMHETRAGRQPEMPLTPVGDAQLMDKIGAAFVAGHKVAAMPSILPDV